MQKNWLRRTVLFLTGQTVSLFGSALVQYAITWHVTLTTKSGVMMTIVTLCGFLPQVLVGLFAGAWADRYNRKHLILLADGMIASCTAVLAVLFSLGHTEIWLLFIVSVVRSIGGGIQMPAVSAFLPQLVPEQHLIRVNGLNASINSMMLLVAPLAAGGLYAAMGMDAVFWVDVATAAVGMSLLAVLKVDARPKPLEAQQHILRDMLGGIRYVAGTRWLREFMGFYLFFAFMYGPAVVLTPLMVARSFGDEPWRLMVHEMVFAGGSIIGGLLLGLLGTKFRNKMRMLVLASLAFGALTFIMGFSPNFWFYLGVMLPVGITVPVINAGAMTVLQTRVRPDLMGRVFGLVTIIGSGAVPLSMVVFGPLADVIRVETQLIITGVLMMVISLGMLRFKEVMAAGEPLPAPAPAPEEEASTPAPAKAPGHL